MFRRINRTAGRPKRVVWGRSGWKEPMRWVVLLATAWIGAVAAPVSAARGRVLLIPATIPGRHQVNAGLVTEALKANLQRHGFEVEAPPDLEALRMKHQVEAQQPLPLALLFELRQQQNVDFVIYPRILNVGVDVFRPAGDLVDGYQANHLLNVVGPFPNQFFHTVQLGQKFRPKDGGQAPIMEPEDAREAAVRLLEYFYVNVRNRRPEKRR